MINPIQPSQLNIRLDDGAHGIVQFDADKDPEKLSYGERVDGIVDEGVGMGHLEGGIMSMDVGDNGYVVGTDTGLCRYVPEFGREKSGDTIFYTDQMGYGTLVQLNELYGCVLASKHTNINSYHIRNHTVDSTFVCSALVRCLALQK